ncbi:hypothetical protein AAG906_041048 [Vitis piasezkii]
MLALPDHTKVFEVHTDASDFAIEGVLMQDRHPIAFENHKLNDTERHFLAEFDYTLEYKPGNTNHVVDALSRKAELASMTSQPQGDIMDHLREGLQHDPVAKSLIVLAHEGKTKRFWVEDDLLYTKGRRLYCHDTKWVGHPGQQRTRALLESAYYWPQIWDEVKAYVSTCLVC